jgi:hypothetical protein
MTIRCRNPQWRLAQQSGKVSGKPGSQPAVNAVMKRAAQAKQKIQQTKVARNNKVAQARGLPQAQNPRKGNKPQMVRLAPTKQQGNKPFIFRGNNRGQSQGRGQMQAQTGVPMRRGRGRGGQRGGATGFRVVVSADPAHAASFRGRGQQRVRGRGARGRGSFGGGNQLVSLACIRDQKAQVVSNSLHKKHDPAF